MTTKISAPKKRAPWRDALCSKTDAPCIYTTAGRCRDCGNHRPPSFGGIVPSAALLVQI